MGEAEQNHPKIPKLIERRADGKSISSNVFDRKGLNSKNAPVCADQLQVRQRSSILEANFEGDPSKIGGSSRIFNGSKSVDVRKENDLLERKYNAGKNNRISLEMYQQSRLRRQ